MQRFQPLGIVLLVFGILAPWSPSQADVVITELMYHPSSDLDGDEFIELLNTGASDVDLQGWCFDGVDLCFPPGAMILAGGRVVLAHDAARFEATYGFVPHHVYTARLDNGGERLALLDGASQLVDEVSYLDLPPWPVTPDGLGPSLEVIDPAQDNAMPRNWRASIDAGGHTAGAINSVDGAGLPPWIEQPNHTVDPAPAAAIVVTARLYDATTVELYYRIDFGAETMLVMLDDGASQDGAAGDGTYGASIPGQPAGTLIRYRIAASGATGSMDFPRDDDTVTYDGTAVRDPTLSSNLPVFWWFMDPVDYQASLDHRHTDQLEPAVLYHEGTLIDGIQVRVRGQSARNYPKKHWKFRMPLGHPFYDPDLAPIPLDQFNLQGNYSDKIYARERLSYGTFLETGSPAPITHSVRLQQNGEFYGLNTFLQAMDDDYLTTNNLDENGAWYKAFDSCQFRSLGNLPGRYEKKTRLDEGYEDLFALLDGANNLSGQARRDFLFDNVDIAGMANYLATTVVIHNTDFPHKNYFLYRDTEGTGRWTMHPWDMDLTFGRNWQGTVLNDEIWADRDTISGRPAEVSPSHPRVGEAEHKNWDTRWNRLIDALYEQPEFLEMYYRRLRTLVDWLLADGRFETRIDELTIPMAAEAELDRTAWGQYGQSQSMAEAVAILKAQYLEVRRTHLLVNHRVPGEIPEAQSASLPIVISEIMYNPAGGPDHEFVELYNPSPTEAVDLSGYRLDGVALSVPSGTVILPDDFLIVASNDPAFRAEYGSGKFVAAHYGGALDNGGEAVTLRDRDGNTVARVDFTDALPWPTDADGAGPSLELIDPTTDNGWVANWAPSTAPGGTPGAPNSVAGSIAPHPGVYINEVLPLNATINPDEQGDFHSWIELYNANPGPIDLGGMFLTNVHAQPDMWEIPAGTQLCGGCFVLVWTDNEPGEGPLHATFQINPFGGTVGLYDAAGGIIDYTDYGILASDTSFGRFPDGKPDQRVLTAVTPAAANNAILIPLILNEYNAVNPGELLENNGSDTFWGTVIGNGGDWFELVVTADHLDLRGWGLVLSNDTGGPGETQQLLTFGNDALWADVRSGVLITVSEDLPSDAGYDPAGGDSWINVQAADSAPGTYITAQDFTVSSSNWQLTIVDDLGETVFGPAGEGVNPVTGIGGDEVFKLEQDPGPFITRFAIYNDGSSSTFGAPNRYAAGTLEQDFGMLRCDGQVCVSLDGPCSLGICDTGSGQCEAGGICALTGAVLYYRDGVADIEPGDAPVPDVEIDVDGDLLVDVLTAVDGTYVAPDRTGVLVVTPLDRFGDGEISDANGAISSFDAAFIAQHSVQMIDLSANQQVAADVSGNGSITSFDSARVSQYAVQLIEHFPVAEVAGSDWVYLRCDNYVDADDQDCVAPLYTHDPLLAAENDDFYAMLYGDVSGNWSSSGTELASSTGPAETEAARVDRRRALALSHDSELSLRGDVNAFELSPRTSFRARVLQEESADGRSRRVIVSVKEGEAIQALDVKLSYGPQGVEVLGFETTSLTQEFDVVVHDSESVFRAAAWSVLPLGGSGDVFVLTLRHRSAAVETGPLRLEILANEQVFVVVIPGPGRTVREGPSHPRTPRIRP